MFEPETIVKYSTLTAIILAVVVFVYRQFVDSETVEQRILRIGRIISIELLAAYGKKSFYAISEVEAIFRRHIKPQTEIDYAFAMFCSAEDYQKVQKSHQLNQSYEQLRLQIAKICFQDWPSYNFDSFLALSEATPQVGGG